MDTIVQFKIIDVNRLISLLTGLDLQQKQTSFCLHDSEAHLTVSNAIYYTVEIPNGRQLYPNDATAVKQSQSYCVSTLSQPFRAQAPLAVQNPGGAIAEPATSSRP